MKAVHIVPVLSLFAVASAAYVLLRTVPDPAPMAEPNPLPVEPQAEGAVAVPSTNIVPEEAKEPVQPLDERGDAMLFEVEALGNTPFDEAIVKPFE